LSYILLLIQILGKLDIDLQGGKNEPNPLLDFAAVYADRKEFPGLFDISRSGVGNGVELNDRQELSPNAAQKLPFVEG
jgi:hypothetical protein